MLIFSGVLQNIKAHPSLHTRFHICCRSTNTVHRRWIHLILNADKIFCPTSGTKNATAMQTIRHTAKNRTHCNWKKIRCGLKIPKCCVFYVKTVEPKRKKKWFPMANTQQWPSDTRTGRANLVFSEPRYSSAIGAAKRAPKHSISPRVGEEAWKKIRALVMELIFIVCRTFSALVLVQA